MSSDCDRLVASKPTAILRSRPAETATPVAMAIALLIARAVGVDDAFTVGYIAIIVSFVPAAVTWIVNLIRSRGGSVNAEDSQPAQGAGS